MSRTRRHLIWATVASVATSGLAIATLHPAHAESLELPAPGTFIQAGTPAAQSGSLIPLGDSTVLDLSAGAPNDAVAIATGPAHALILRDDGTPTSIATNALPTRPGPYVAISTDDRANYFLHADGSIEAISRGTSPAPAVPDLPDGTTYVGIDGQGGRTYALRSDGTIAVVLDAADRRCAEAFTPPAETRYTAVSVSYAGWAALRSDNRVVTCFASEVATVHVPPAGARFIGVEAGAPHGFAATDTGAVVALANDATLIQAPADRRITALATDPPYGVAVLDDHSVLKWTEGGPYLRPLPGGDTYAALAWGESGEGWGILAGDPYDFDVTFDVPPEMHIGNPDASVSVSASYGELPVDMGARLSLVRPDGTRKTLVEQLGRGSIELPLSHRDLTTGAHRLELAFLGYGARPEAHTWTLNVLGPSVTGLNPSLPDLVRFDETAEIPVTVTAAEDVPTNGRIMVRTTGGRIIDQDSWRDLDSAPVSRGQATVLIPARALLPGEQPIQLDFLGTDPVRSSRWTGTVRVADVDGDVPTAPATPAPTRLVSSGEPTWRYGEGPGLEVCAESTDGSPLRGLMQAEGTTYAPSQQCVRPGATRTPGTYDIKVAYTGWAREHRLGTRDASSTSVRVHVLPPEETRLAVSAPSAWAAPGRENPDVDVEVVTPSGTVDGTVTLTADGRSVATQDVSTSRITFSIAPIRAGTTRVGLVYRADGGGDHAVWEQAVSVARTTTTTTGRIRADGQSTATGRVMYGQQFWVDATTYETWRGGPYGSGMPYQVSVDGEVVGTVPEAHSTYGGLRLDSAAFKPGKHTIKVAFAGNSQWAPSSWTSSFAVTDPNPTITTSVGTAVWRFNLARTVSVRVQTRGVTPTGSVAFYNGGTRLSTVQLSAGTASYRVPANTYLPGTRSLTVKYLGSDYASAKNVTTAVSIAKATFIHAPAPVITGSVRVGGLLGVKRGLWLPTPSWFRYTWTVNGRVVKSGTSATYRIPSSAKGTVIRVKVTAGRAYYVTTARTSAPTEKIGRYAFRAPRPKITGTARVGSTLTAVRGTWSAKPTRIVYAWKVNGTVAKWSTSKYFNVPRTAKGKVVTVTIIGTRPNYTTMRITSDGRRIG
ncbi:MAG TPA: Ig-like domain-containing protein [Jiangellaceae bacterium]